MKGKHVLVKLNGVLAVKKPKGITSAAVCNKIRDNLLKEVGIKTTRPEDAQKLLKIGHGGTLDSYATGVLAVGVGQGCSRLPALLHGGKSYMCMAKFGQQTDTDHSDGDIILEKPYDHITYEQLLTVVNRFGTAGILQQVPPLYSALRIHGTRMSDIARSGQTLTNIKSRSVTIYQLKLISFDMPTVELEVSCGGGFYVRSLVRDIGLELESCAYVCQLQRTAQGPFTIEDSSTLNEEQWTLDNIRKSIMSTEKRHSRFFFDAFKKNRKVS